MDNLISIDVRVNNERRITMPCPRLSFAWFLLVLMFLPLSVTIGGQGISANYLFAILLLIGSFRALAKWDAVVVFYILFCFVSYIVGALFLSGFETSFLLRQSISFIIFLLPLLLLLIRVPYSVNDICSAAFVVACLYSAYSLWIVLSHHMLPIENTFVARAYLQDYIPDYPQRFIMVVLFSVFYGISRIKKSIWYFPAVLLLLFSVYISFTRAAWLGLICGLLAYGASILWSMLCIGKIRFKPSRMFKRLGIFVVLVFAVIGISFSYPSFIESIKLQLSRIVYAFSTFFHDPQSFNPEGSEGTRMQIWSKVIEIVMTLNPISGTGFAGLYQFTGNKWGSTHSQYFDVFLRTGFIGLGFYLFFWFKALRSYLTTHGVFGGLIALFVFGFSQETTKYSYGALLFFLLLNKVYFDKIILPKKGNVGLKVNLKK